MLAYSLRVHSPLCSNDTVGFTAVGTCVVREEHAVGMPHIVTGQETELGECLDSVGFIHFFPFLSDWDNSPCMGGADQIQEASFLFR